MPDAKLLCGDCLKVLRAMPDESVHCCVTSPPYWGLRDYGHDGQIGLEPTPDAYVARMVEVFREVRRVLRNDGTLWLNLGDSYASTGTVGRNDTSPEALARRARQYGTGTGSGSLVGSHGMRPKVANLKQKDLVGIPWRVAFALQSDGWWLRQDIIWAKPNPMPESVRDRCTKAHEYLFLLAKSERYFYDAEAVSEALSGKPHAPGNKCSADGGHLRNDFGTDAMQRVWGASGRRNRRSVWTVTTKPYSGAHFATFPPKLIEPCILAGCPERCCAECGAGWERVVERTAATPQQRTGYTMHCGGRNDGERPGHFVDHTCRTIGHRPTCECNAATIPGTVLDPFAGSGTTLAVAIEHGRNSIGIELNPAYIDLANKRIAESRDKLGMFAGVN